MKIIRVMETATPIERIYRQANTPNQRALLGYIIRKGYTDDYVLLGALHLLREIERANESKMLYQLLLDGINAQYIVDFCELAQQGAFNPFAMSATEIRKCIKLMEL